MEHHKDHPASRWCIVPSAATNGVGDAGTMVGPSVESFSFIQNADSL